jgi:hypothetical protein
MRPVAFVATEHRNRVDQSLLCDPAPDRLPDRRPNPPVDRCRSIAADAMPGPRVAPVVRKPSTPTPAGLFSIIGTWTDPPDAFLGAWILALTAKSNALQQFDGGDGTVGIHGRGGASLLDPLGSAASHGCIRVDNSSIDWLVGAIGAGALPGIPVRVG